MATKTVISLSAPTPKWATWIFRIVFFLTTAISFWIAGTKLIQDDLKIELMLALKAFDVFIWGCSKGIGVKKEDFEQELDK